LVAALPRRRPHRPQRARLHLDADGRADDRRDPAPLRAGGAVAPSVVVVGGGALGLCTAFALTELGVADVTVLERHQIASASSGLSVGIIETQYLDPLAIEVRAYSMGFFGRLERDAGLPITRNGYLRLGHSQEDVAAFERS